MNLFSLILLFSNSLSTVRNFLFKTFSDIIYMWNLKQQTSKYNKQKVKKQTHRHREQASGYPWGDASRERQFRAGAKELWDLCRTLCINLLKIIRSY